MDGRETTMTLLEESYLCELRAVRQEHRKDLEQLARLRAERDQLRRELSRRAPLTEFGK